MTHRFKKALPPFLLVIAVAVLFMRNNGLLTAGRDTGTTEMVTVSPYGAIVETSGVQVWEDISSDDPLCGPKSLLRILEIVKGGCPLPSLQEICELSGYDNKSGTTMLGLYNAAEQLGLPVVPLNLGPDELLAGNAPAIAFVDGDHFIVVHGRGMDDNIVLQNPPEEAFSMTVEQFVKRWKGQTLVFSEELRAAHETQLASLMQPSGPGIRFNRATVDFRNVPEGEKLTYTFDFYNTGKDVLEINARSSCTCTAALLSGNRIPPGGKGEIRVEFDTQGYNGPVEQLIFVRTNDLDNRMVTLTLRAVVEPSILAVPDRLWIDNLVAGQKITRTVRLLRKEGVEMDIRRIAVPEGIEASIVNETDAEYRLQTDGGWEMALGGVEEDVEGGESPESLTAEETGALYSTVIKLVVTRERPGNFEEEIVIHTGNSTRPEIKIPVSGIALAEMNAVPPAFYFGEVQANRAESREVTLVFNGGTEKSGDAEMVMGANSFSNANLFARTDAKGVTVAIERSENGSGEYKMTAFLEPQQTAGMIKENVSLYTGEGQEAVLNIPLFAVIK